MLEIIVGIFFLFIMLVVASLPIVLPILLIVFIFKRIYSSQDNEYHYKSSGLKKKELFQNHQPDNQNDESIPCEEFETYDDLLQRDEWKDKRLKILNRDNNRCVYCGSNANLNVHHKYYYAYPNGRKVEPWNYPDNALITLCENCHHKVHKRKKVKWYHISYGAQFE